MGQIFLACRKKRNPKHNTNESTKYKEPIKQTQCKRIKCVFFFFFLRVCLRYHLRGSGKELQGTIQTHRGKEGTVHAKPYISYCGSVIFKGDYWFQQLISEAKDPKKGKWLSVSAC